ncbi:MAG: tRNA (adenosine(37)-N6)-threonylcarbamoyltransferase complex dimerization subunit type 1 TsaB [Clostridia bacterium]|nr:tRNA (adenosine(37)-N6)-threonylcarbamoyltransferase complex dimerization subunit type 1 TsaB [Clostridia bacterium]
MKILALECSAGPASTAIVENGIIIASNFTNVKMTHSETLLPMVKATLDKAGLSVADIDALAISNGPGSFTGIRIGISAVKGLAAPKKLPCYAVSTLRAIAENYKGFDGVVCSVMDARCNQVYNALFKAENGNLTRLCDDRALLISELMNELSDISENIIIVGDGAALFSEFASEKILIANEENRYQTAVGVAMAASEYESCSPDKLMPFYLRLPQAERELKAKKEKM